MPEEQRLDLGIVVTPDGRVYELEFSTRECAPEAGVFCSWRELTGIGEHHPFAPAIAVTLHAAAGGPGTEHDTTTAVLAGKSVS